MAGVEKCVGDEDFLIQRARSAWAADPNVAKAWMLTAQAIFQDSFRIQFEAYTLEKEARNYAEAAVCFDSVLSKFPLEGVLWQEVQDITSALRNDSGDSVNVFYRSLFSKLPSESQYQLLLKASDHSEDTMEHCRLLLLLLEKFPKYISQHGPKLVDTLLSAEKHSHLATPGNSYRELLVCELLPLLLGQPGVELPPKQLYKLLQKALEFHLTSLMDATNAPGPSGSISNANAASKTNSKSWESLFGLLENAGKHLGWQQFHQFNASSVELLCQRLTSMSQLRSASSPEDVAVTKQVLYQASVLFLHCLHDYASAVEPATAPPNLSGVDRSSPPLVLVEAFSDAESVLGVADFKPSKRKKMDDDDVVMLSPPVQLQANVSRSQKVGVSSLVRSFQTAAKCWELLHSTPNLDREFSRLMQQLRSDLWPWLQTFLVDLLTLQGRFSEAVTQLTAAGQSDMSSMGQCKRALQLASLNYAMGKYSASCEQILQVVAHLPPVVNSSSSAIVIPGDRNLQFLQFTHAPVLHYCIRILIQGLKARVTREDHSMADDMSLGHLMTLLQMDWPQEESTFLRLVEIIIRRGSFTYPQFSRYVINADMLEEMAFLVSDQGGGVTLDLAPGTSGLPQWNRERRISTRGIEKGSKDDLRAFLRRQMSRSSEPLDLLLVRFLAAEGGSILM